MKKKKDENGERVPVWKQEDLKQNIEVNHQPLIEKSMSYLEVQALKANCPASYRLLTWDDFHRKGYGSASAKDNPHSHHCYPGGLAVHTAEVLRNALAMAEATGADPKILIPAAIYHDAAKIWEYDAEGNKLPFRKMIRHVAGGFSLWIKDALEEGYEHGFVHAVAHCILAHHGKCEWGSPVEPQTVEAQVLHYADMLSVMYGAGR